MAHTYDVAGPSSKSALAPIIEEEETLRCSEDAADLEAEKETPAGHGGDDTFEGLSDLIITSQELFKDDVPKAASPVVEATSTFQQILTPATQVTTTLVPKSGL